MIFPEEMMKKKEKKGEEEGALWQNASTLNVKGGPSEQEENGVNQRRAQIVCPKTSASNILVTLVLGRLAPLAFGRRVQVCTLVCHSTGDYLAHTDSFVASTSAARGLDISDFPI